MPINTATIQLALNIALPLLGAVTLIRVAATLVKEHLKQAAAPQISDNSDNREHSRFIAVLLKLDRVLKRKALELPLWLLSAGTVIVTILSFDGYINAIVFFALFEHIILSICLNKKSYSRILQTVMMIMRLLSLVAICSVESEVFRCAIANQEISSLTTP